MRNCEVPRNEQDALNGVVQTWTGLSISTKDLSNFSSGPIIFFPSRIRYIITKGGVAPNIVPDLERWI
jgi:hypothetical protein